MPDPRRPSDAARPVGERSGTAGFALVVLGALLWGTSGLVGATLHDRGLPTTAVAALRLLVGGALLVLVLVATRRLRLREVPPAGWRRVAATALLAAAYQAAYFLAVSLSGVGVATLVALGGAPLVTALALAVLDRRRPSAVTVAGLALGLAGLALLVGVPTGRGTSSGVPLALVSAAAFAAMTLVNRRPLAGLGPVALTGTAFTLGGLLLVPAVLTVAAPAPSALRDPTTAGLVVLLAVVPTALAYAAYFSGLAGVPATTATVVALLEPLVATVGAVVLLDERLSTGAAAGAALLLLAVVVLRPGGPAGAR